MNSNNGCPSVVVNSSPSTVHTNVPATKQCGEFIPPVTAPPIAPHMKPSAAPYIDNCFVT